MKVTYYFLMRNKIRNLSYRRTKFQLAIRIVFVFKSSVGRRRRHIIIFRNYFPNQRPKPVNGKILMYRK